RDNNHLDEKAKDDKDSDKAKLLDGYDLIDNSLLQELREYIKRFPHQIDHCDPLKGTLVMWAIRRGDMTALELLHSLNANLEQVLFNLTMNRKQTNFENAIWNREKIAEQLLKWGASTEATDKGFWTPLLYSCIQGNAKMVQILAKHGANLNRMVYTNKTSLTLVAERGMINCLQVMKSLGIDLKPAVAVVQQSKRDEMTDSLRKRCLILQKNDTQHFLLSFLVPFYTPFVYFIHSSFFEIHHFFAVVFAFYPKKLTYSEKNLKFFCYLIDKKH
ncbi:ankyrin repeat protein, partial [Reticulomyxa filosa]